MAGGSNGLYEVLVLRRRSGCVLFRSILTLCYFCGTLSLAGILDWGFLTCCEAELGRDS